MQRRNLYEFYSILHKERSTQTKKFDIQETGNQTDPPPVYVFPPPPTMGRIIALPHPKNLSDFKTGKPMLIKFVLWIGIRNFTYLLISTWYLNINGCCKAIKIDQNITGTSLKPRWVDTHINNFLTIQARELKFCVCYLREKSAPLTNFQPNWTTTSKVSDFGHFIYRVS